MLKSLEDVAVEPKSIAIARDETEARAPLIRRVLIAVDASEPAMWAIDFGAVIARQFGAQVALVHVIDTASVPPSPDGVFTTVVSIEDMRDEAVTLLDCAKKRLVGDVQPGTVILEGDPARGIVSAAEDWEADLIVLGTHARGRIARWLLGSCVQWVLRHAPCPVLTIGHPVRRA